MEPDFSHYDELVIALEDYHGEIAYKVAGKIQQYVTSVGIKPTLVNAKRAWKAIIATARLYNGKVDYSENIIQVIRDYAEVELSRGHMMGIFHMYYNLWENDVTGEDAYWYIVDPEVLIEEVANVPAPKNDRPLTLIMSPIEAERLYNTLNSDGFACAVTPENWKLAFSGVPLDELEGHPLEDVTSSVDDKVVLSQVHFYYLMINLIEKGAITYNNSSKLETFTALTGWTKSPTSAASSFAREKELNEYNRKAKTFLDDVIRSFTKL